jgi:sensor c-di-GMP phosphodiesterase-like protein
MYKAKQLGKNRWHIFDLIQDVAVKNRHEEIERLRLALQNEEFVLFYQPKID